MANYQTPYDSTLNHQGENDAAAQSGASCHPVQHAQGAMDNTTALSLPTQTPAANEAEEVMGRCMHEPHARVNFHPTHTCAVCKITCLNNYSLEKHAAKKHHKAFLCTCTTGAVRLGTLNRHIATQAGPKHHCTYCDDKKGFSREDKLIDHLRDSHKFGKNAIAQFRSQARAQPKENGHVSSEIATTGASVPVSFSAGYDAVPDGTTGQAVYSAGPSAAPVDIVDGGLTEIPMFSAAEYQAFGAVDDYPSIGAAEDFAGFDFCGFDLSGVDFADFDGNMDLSGMDNHL